MRPRPARPIPMMAAIVCLALSAGAISARECTDCPFACEGVDEVAGDSLELELVSDQLNRPVDVTAPPGDTGRVFVVEQSGRIRIIDLAGDTLRAQPFLDISSRVRCCGERGLLGLAFHPDYATNGYFFVNYTRNPDGATVVSRFGVSQNDPDEADAASELRLLVFSQPAGNHNGGQVAFGPNDGYLYVSTGDGGSGCDRAGSGNNAQNPASLLGKVLRIDVDGRDGNLNYAIPPDNPFRDTVGFRPEIWALGLRNPWRMSFDPLTGDLYIADVGQNRIEEIDYQPGTSSGGENYEWRRLEGTQPSSISGCSSATLTGGVPSGPIFEYSHGGGVLRGCSVTGGVIYRGCRMPDLRGSYFFADYCNNWVATLRVRNGQVEPGSIRDRTTELNRSILPDTVDDISAFGVDGRGEVYVCDLSTKLFRIAPVSTVPAGPRFRRADTNADGAVDISDPIFLLVFLFADRAAPPCRDAADADDNGSLEVTDAIWTLEYLFNRGTPPPAPGATDCGEDETPEVEELDCASYSCGA